MIDLAPVPNLLLLQNFHSVVLASLLMHNEKNFTISALAKHFHLRKVLDRCQMLCLCLHLIHDILVAVCQSLLFLLLTNRSDFIELNCFIDAGWSLRLARPSRFIGFDLTLAPCVCLLSLSIIVELRVNVLLVCDLACRVVRHPFLWLHLSVTVIFF